MKGMTRFGFTLFLVAVVSGVWVSVRGESELFDLKRSQRDIEVMRGILDTTLSFVSNDLKSLHAGQRWSLRSIDGFYLYGQGAVFVIPIPSVARPLSSGGYAVHSGSADAAVAFYTAAAAMGRSRESGGSSASAEDLVESLREAEEGNEKLKSKIEEEKEEYKKLLAAHETLVDRIEGELIETLANHGGSLTQVKPEEYVTLILAPGKLGFVGFGRGKSPSRIVSVKRATIADHMAGKLTLEQFQAKVLRYGN